MPQDLGMIKLQHTRRHSEHGTRNCLQRLNQIYKTSIKRCIFDESDEIEIRLPCC